MNTSIGEIILMAVVMLASCPAWCATESFYMTATGRGLKDGTALENAFGPAEFNNTGKWALDNMADGLIGPNDEVLLYDDDGIYATYLLPQKSGLAGEYITIKAASGETPIFDMQGAQLYCIYNDAKNYIVYEGLIFKNALNGMLQIDHSHDIVARNNKYSGSFGGSGVRMHTLTAVDVYNIEISSSSFYDLNEDGILMSFIGTVAGGATGEIHDITISSCTFENLVDNVTLPYGTRFLFANRADCLTHNRLPYGLTYTHNVFNKTSAPAISLYSDNNDGTATNLIAWNTIIDAGFGNLTHTNAIQAHYSKNLVIEHNNIDGVYTVGPGDGNGIICDWSAAVDLNNETYNSQGTIVRYNIVSGATGMSESAGISVYACNDCLVYGNVAYDNNVGIKNKQATTTGTRMYNNTSVNNVYYNFLAVNNSIIALFKNNLSYGSENGVAAITGGGFLNESNNLSFGATTADFSGIIPDITDIQADPEFINIGSGNFNPDLGSPAIDVGVDTGLPFLGANPDIGAFECAGSNPDTIPPQVPGELVVE